MMFVESCFPRKRVCFSQPVTADSYHFSVLPGCFKLNFQTDQRPSFQHRVKMLLNYCVSVYVMAKAGRVEGAELRNGLQRGSVTEKLMGSEESGWVLMSLPTPPLR